MAFEIIYSRYGESGSRLVNDDIANYEEDMSEIISRILSHDHVDKPALEILRDFTFVTECIAYNLHNLYTFLTGSYIDCSYLKTSDQDQMAQINHTVVVNPNELPTEITGNILMTEMKNVIDGYTRLVPVQSGDITLMETVALLNSYFIIDNKTYISSEKYLLQFKTKMSDMDQFSPPTFSTDLYTHGPCVLLKRRIEVQSETDIGIGLSCKSWPDECNEWTNRQRSSNWPSIALIERLKSLPCHIFPVGTPDSATSQIEWRYAFILPERELTWNFSNTQIQCYFIFKSLVKCYLESVYPDQINSFHLKTIMFWLSENLNSEKWSSRNLIWCVKQCFKTLIQSIKSKHLSHYFLRKRNLFFNKLADSALNTLLLQKIDEITTDITMSFVQCSEQFHADKSLLSNMFHILLEIHNQQDFFKVAKIILEKTGNEETIDFYARMMSAHSTLMILSMPINFDQLTSIIESVDKQFGDSMTGLYCKQFLSIRCGMDLLAQARESKDKEARKTTLVEAKNCFVWGSEHDSLASWLYLATYHYNVGNYREIKEFLTKLFKTNVPMKYTGSGGQGICSRKAIISPDMDHTMLSVKQIKDIVFDMLFSCTDISCVPFALKFECALLGGQMNWSFCMLHPLVYASYLQFQVAFNLHETDLHKYADHLASTVDYVEGKAEGLESSIESHRHHNILGYCYLALGDGESAAASFIKSLRIRPSTGNAAAYHLCIVLFKII